MSRRKLAGHRTAHQSRAKTRVTHCIDASKVARARREARSEDEVQFVADMFRILGDPTRLRLLDVLARQELCVGDLSVIVDASQSTVSHSLRALRQLRLVRSRREGQIAYYSLDDDHVARLLEVAFGHADARNQ